MIYSKFGCVEGAVFDVKIVSSELRVSLMGLLELTTWLHDAGCDTG